MPIAADPLWTCAECGALVLVTPHVTNDMLTRALSAYREFGRVEEAADFEGAMREAIAAALGIDP